MAKDEGTTKARKNTQFLFFDIHAPVFFTSAICVAFMTIIALVLPVELSALLSKALAFSTKNFGWLLAGLANTFVLMCLLIIISPFGKIRIGGTDARPEFGLLSWFAMLFAAGMGIGLVFYGVAEPVSHFTSSLSGGVHGITNTAPLGGALGDVAQSQSISMATTFMHWALHPWAMFALVGLTLALCSYNSGLPLTIRSGFHPIFGDRVWGRLGDVIEVLAILATVFGLATSLGLGAKQALAGISFRFGTDINNLNQIYLIAFLALITIVSLSLGLKKGVRRLSEVNLCLAFLLCAFIIWRMPISSFALNFGANLKSYVQHLPELMKISDRNDSAFFADWTVFYWAWWASWSPFVGLFIARISKGRTVREFLCYVVLVPSLISAVWMTAFGNISIAQVKQGLNAELSQTDLPLQLFVMLDALPLTAISSIIAILLILIFFVTSWDSGVLVLDSISSGGRVQTGRRQRIFWVVLIGFLATALLIGGGLKSLQTASILAGIPFMVLIGFLNLGLLKTLIKKTKESKTHV